MLPQIEREVPFVFMFGIFCPHPLYLRAGDSCGWRHYVFRLPIRPSILSSRSCERAISGVLGGDFITSVTDVYLNQAEISGSEK